MAIAINLNKSTTLNINEVGSFKIETNINGSDKNSYDVVNFYERSSGKAKIIERYTNDNKQILLSAEEMVVDYDYTFVVDTNYKCIDGVKKCVGTIGRLIYDNTEKKFGLEKSFHCYFELSDFDINPEWITWAKLIEEINHSSIASNKILIVVDSDLGNYEHYNQGKEIYNGIKLSKNMKLAYASADKKDTLFNHAIRECDKAATELLKKYLSRQ